MMKMFLNPDKPLSTCKEHSCDDCNAKTLIHCHFNGKLLMRFLMIAFPCLLIAGIGIFRFNYLFILPWIIFTLLFFGFIEIRVLCSHCPHYAEPESKTLKCWANYGSPKIWKYRPGPMNIPEKIIFFSGILFIFLYPVVLMAISQQFILLSLLMLFIIIGVSYMYRYMCKKCMNFACPFNCVPQETREIFSEHN
ncbi:hypothetical protein [Acetobacterium bakii]|uniref:Uncharacterized protein n=1 Tax=Acetobacterium bakii TaxID=52689 RepID=A0A0L6TZM8_9FIRM|nr:hypothetical protein [Acetobacterium bakii]KNZ41721.1 hypothetical protein AKG39_10350 [Acetobacterium bakii]